MLIDPWKQMIVSQVREGHAHLGAASQEDHRVVDRSVQAAFDVQIRNPPLPPGPPPSLSFPASSFSVARPPPPAAAAVVCADPDAIDI